MDILKAEASGEYDYGAMIDKINEQLQNALGDESSVEEEEPEGESDEDGAGEAADEDEAGDAEGASIADAATPKKVSAGGSVRLAWAWGRSIAMRETFDRPLVIGYNGFDFPILENGEIGPPVPTIDALEKGKYPRQITTATLGDPTESQVDYGIFLTAISRREVGEQEKILDLAADGLGKAFQAAYQEDKAKQNRTAFKAFKYVKRIPDIAPSGVGSRQWEGEVVRALRHAWTKVVVGK